MLTFQNWKKASTLFSVKASLMRFDVASLFFLVFSKNTQASFTKVYLNSNRISSNTPKMIMGTIFSEEIGL